MAYNKRIYIVLLSNHIGGSEFRFIKIFSELATRKKPVYLIVYDGFIDIIKKHKSFENFNHSTRLISLKKSDFHSKNSFKDIYKEILQIVSTTDTIHFIQNFPATYRGVIKNKCIYTFNENSRKRFSYKDHIFFLLTVLRSNKVDILDPIIHKKIKKTFFYKKNILLTHGGIVEHLFNFNFEHKENSISFLGRFNDQKQALKFVECIEGINTFLKKNNISNVSYNILGGGPQEKEILEISEKLNKKGVIVNVKYTNNPAKYLEKSKVFLSLQKYNNYPSNSLIEAIAYGNIPIVTDNGTTRHLAKENFSFFVSEDFDSIELAHRIQSILSLDKSDYMKKVELGMQLIDNNFHIEKSIDYYLNLYELK